MLFTSDKCAFLYQQFGNLQQSKQISDPTTWISQGCGFPSCSVLGIKADFCREWPEHESFPFYLVCVLALTGFGKQLG